jgi:hypothetical protein
VIAVASLALFLLGSGAPGEPAAPSLDLGLDLEYSTFLDIHRRALGFSDSRAAPNPFGLRAHLFAREGGLAIGPALTLFPARLPVASFDLQIFYLRRWTRLALGGGGGAGVFVTPRESGVPTFTDTVSGGAVHLRGALRWYASASVFFSAELALYLYPSQPLFTLPVGLDGRWSVGLGLSR